MEFSSAIYRGDPCPEFSFSFKYAPHGFSLKFLFHFFIPPPSHSSHYTSKAPPASD